MIAAFDLDGTLLKKNVSFAFCRYLCKRGYLSKFDLLFCTAVYLRHLYCGLALLHLHTLVFNRLFRGKKISALLPYVRDFITHELTNLWYVPAIKRLKELQEGNTKCIILSNSPLFLVGPIAKEIGVQEVFATEYLKDNEERLVQISSLVDGREKQKLLVSLTSEKKIAFSDSELDIPFLRAADIAVAVNPKRKLKRLARRENWEIL